MLHYGNQSGCKYEDPSPEPQEASQSDHAHIKRLRAQVFVTEVGRLQGEKHYIAEEEAGCLTHCIAC